MFPFDDVIMWHSVCNCELLCWFLNFHQVGWKTFQECIAIKVGHILNSTNSLGGNFLNWSIRLKQKKCGLHHRCGVELEIRISICLICFIVCKLYRVDNCLERTYQRVVSYMLGQEINCRNIWGAKDFFSYGCIIPNRSFLKCHIDRSIWTYVLRNVISIVQRTFNQK